MKWKCKLCPTLISGNINRKYCGECLRVRKNELMNKRNRYRSIQREFKKIKINMTIQPYLMK